jgi:hypothetical protein
MVAVVATVAVVLGSGLQHAYAKGPAPCDKLDTSAVGTVLGLPARATRPESAGDTCQVDFDGSDGIRVAAVDVTLTWADNAFVTRCNDRITKNEYPGTTTAIDALGDAARLTVDPEADTGTCGLQLIALDSNVRVQLTLSLLADQAAKPCTRLDELSRVVVQAVRGLLTEL